MLILVRDSFNFKFMIAAATESLALDKLPFGWFDVVFAALLAFGAYRGRQNGLTKELVPTFRWVAIVLAGGLGYEFAGEVKKAIERIVQFPEAWAFISRRVRHCRVSRFPYAVLYQAMEGTLLIVAVMHLHREPDSWKARLKE